MTYHSEESGSAQRLSKKEMGKKLRHEAYLRAKEYRKTDPRQIALKEKLKEQRKEVYQEIKERDKAYRDKQKRATKEKAATKKNINQKKPREMVVPGSTITPLKKLLKT